MNTVLFDYRSGLFESKETFDITQQTDFANFLNNLATDKILLMAVKDSAVYDQKCSLALLRLGFSAKYATPNPATSRSSMAAVIFTGQERKSWETINFKIGGTGASVVKMNINVFRDFKGTGDCSEELGIRTGKIANSRFHSKSIYSNDNNHAGYQARLHKYTPGWCAAFNAPVSDFLQVDLGLPKLISGIAIQGHGTATIHFVSKFNLTCSSDGIVWLPVKSLSGTVKEFHGLKTGLWNETHVSWFQKTLTRFVKIIPTARVTPAEVRTHCLRFELFGCSVDKPMFLGTVFGSSSKPEIGRWNKRKLSVLATASVSRSIRLGVSTAAEKTDFVRYIDHSFIHEVNESITLDNGTILENSGNITKVKNDTTNCRYMAFVDFDVQKDLSYKLDISIGSRVCIKAFSPSGGWTGNRPFSYSKKESELNGICIDFVELSVVKNCDRSSNATQ